MKTSVVVAATVGTAVTGFLAYAIYFDHKRRTDPEFRKFLKREARRQARVAKEEAEAEGVQHRAAIKAAYEDAQVEGFPTDVEEREAYFMNEVAKGEQLCQDSSNIIEAALCFYKALKVYPQPRDLIGIYDKTVPKEVLETLAEMVALDSDLSLGGSFGGGSGSESGHGVE